MCGLELAPGHDGMIAVNASAPETDREGQTPQILPSLLLLLFFFLFFLCRS